MKMILTRSKLPNVGVHIDGQIIKKVEEHRHLGLIQQNNRKCGSQIKDMVIRPDKRLCIMSQYSNRVTLTQFYRSYIRPIIEYRKFRTINRTFSPHLPRVRFMGRCVLFSTRGPRKINFNFFFTNLFCNPTQANL